MLLVKSFAKINLFLHIVGKREDGYHLLESLFAKLQLHDVITVEEDEDLFCECSNREITEPNIVIKAAAALQALSDIKVGAKIKIEKKIPLGAGLGGGSANAASVLIALNKLWNLKLSQSELMEIGLKIGADVPFCLQDRSAFVTGMGEIVTAIPSLGKKLDLLLVNPGYQILAKDTYAKVKNFAVPMRNEAVLDVIFTGKNDLEDAALEIRPELKEVRAALISQGPKIVRMSGSGSTYFAIFDDLRRLQYAQRILTKSYPNWQIWQDWVCL